MPTAKKPKRETCISLFCHKPAKFRGLCRECEEIRRLRERRGYFDSRDLKPKDAR